MASEWNDLNSPLWLSLRVAVTATVLCVLIGTPLAYALARSESRRWQVVEALLLLPLVLPPTVVGYLLLLGFGHAGIGRWLEAVGWPVVFSWRGATIASMVVALPLFVLPVRAALESVETELEEMAAVLGFGRYRTLWHVTLPLARGGFAAGVLLAFARALGEFGATLMVAGNIAGRTTTLPLDIYTAVETGRRSEAIAPVLVLTAVAVLVIALQRRVLRTGNGSTRKQNF